MRTLIFVFALVLGAHLAHGGTAAEQLAQLRPLAFGPVKSAAVARLNAGDPRAKTPMFHGSTLASDWRTLDRVERDEIAAVLREFLARETEAWAKAGEGELIVLQPIGNVPADFAVRCETDRGVREFAISVWSTGYVYAYDQKRHVFGLKLSDEQRVSLQRFAPVHLVDWKSLGQGVQIVGKLGVPLGTAVEIEATVIRGQDVSRYFSLWNTYLLKVDKVAGRTLAPPAPVFFSVSEPDVALAADPCALWELKKGEKADTLQASQIAEVEKDYIGTRHCLLVFEEGTFEGYPPKDLPEGFSFVQRLEEPGLAPGESIRFRPIVRVLRERIQGAAPEPWATP